MKRLALILLALTSTGAAAPVGLIVTEAAKPSVMCEINKIPVSCAYLVALFQKIRDEQRPKERAI